MWKECGAKIRIESTTTRETNQTNPRMKHSQLTAVFSIVMTRNHIRLTKSTFHDVAVYPRFSKIWPMLLIEALCKNVIDLRIQRSADQHERSNDPKIQRSMVLTNRVLNSTKGECDVACEAVTSVVGSSNEVKPQDHIWIFQPMRIHQKFSRENTLHTQPLPSFQMLTHSSLATPLDHAPRSVRTSQ